MQMPAVSRARQCNAATPQTKIKCHNKARLYQNATTDGATTEECLRRAFAHKCLRRFVALYHNRSAIHLAGDPPLHVWRDLRMADLVSPAFLSSCACVVG